MEGDRIMLFRIRKKIYSLLNINETDKYKYECIKIGLAYFTIACLWIYFSDRIANKIAVDSEMLLIISTYKGWLYVVITSIILYLLIRRLIKKVELAEMKLYEVNEELTASNEELEAYIQQLTASEEELRDQYNQIAENEQKLRISEEKNRAIIRAIPDLLFIIDNDGYFIDFSAGDESLLIIPKEAFIGKSIFEVMQKEISKEAYEKMQAVFKFGIMEKFEYKLDISNKELYFEIRMVKNNEKEILAISRNVTERKKAEKELQYLIYHDQLTGLYNRRFFEEELIRLDVENSLPLSIVMADVNGLKLVNDSFGHAIGDELLKKVVQVMKKGFRKDDIIARLAGDEFVVLLPNTNMNETEQIIRNVNALASKEKVGTMDISVSFGFETKNNKEDNIKDILKKAEDYMYKKKLFEGPSMRGKTIQTIVSTLHEKNKREEQHSYRVSKLCESMGIVLGLSEDKVKELKTVGLLHDIGKIAIEENILNKPGKLTDEEWIQIKRHPEIGYRILSTVNELSEMAEYLLSHHERIDGSGYPKGLTDEEIPLQSKIISIADTYDAMVSERSYRNALPEEVAIEELKRNAGSQFDRELTKIFIEKVLNKTF